MPATTLKLWLTGDRAEAPRSHSPLGSVELLVAVGSELFRLRSGLLQSGFTGLLAALLPLAMLRLSRAPSTAEIQIISGLFLVGAATGFVYWLIAGRGAGGERPAQP